MFSKAATDKIIFFCKKWKSFVNFSPFSPANMVPASGGHLSGGWNQAGSFSYDLISSELLLEHDFFKIDINGWSPSPGSDHLTTAWCCHVVMLSAASTSSLSCNLSSRLHNGNWSANLLILNSNWWSIVREPIIWRRYHFSITHYPQLNLKRVL